MSTLPPYQLIVGLEGGLGNRMRTAAATAAIAPHVGAPVAALWAPQWGMASRFDQLFMPVATEAFVLRDATPRERVTAARPRPRNLWLPRLTNRLFHGQVLYNDQVLPLCRQGFDFAAWARRSRSLMWTWWDFHPWAPSLLRSLFRPLPPIAEAIAARHEAFSRRTVGLHIRRTDNAQSIAESPLALFTEAIDAELQSHGDTTFYLATDDQATKEALRQRYGTRRILAAPTAANRDTQDGIREAVVEMFLLARTAHIYGSAGSSFSEIAAKLGDTRLTILSTANHQPPTTHETTTP